MNILKFFYPKNSLKRKIYDISDDIKMIVKPFCKEKFSMYWHGAYWIKPEHLVFWICVQTDQTKSELTVNDGLMDRLRKTLIKHEYPEKAIPFVHIGVESQETVNRESEGDWYLHFK